MKSWTYIAAFWCISIALRKKATEIRCKLVAFDGKLTEPQQKGVEIRYKAVSIYCKPVEVQQKAIDVGCKAVIIYKLQQKHDKKL